ncbi:MAG: GumC family protein, partial [Geminicoccaceae bacterium]
MSTDAIASGRNRRDQDAAEEPYRLGWLTRIANALNRRLGRILLLTLVATTLMTAYVMLRPKVYVAHTDILIDDSSILPADFDEETLRREWRMSRDDLDSEVRLIGSALIVEKVLDDFDSEVSQTLPFSPRRLWRMLIEGEHVADNDFRAASRRLEAFRSNLKIEADPQTSVITIAYRSRVPDVAAKVANGLARQFLEQRTADRQHAIQQASQQIQHLIKTTLAPTSDNDGRVADATSASKETLPIEQRYARVSEELTNATLELADVRARLAKATAADKSGTLIGGLTEADLSSVGVELHERSRELRRQIRTLSERSEIGDIDLIRAETDLAAVHEELEEESARVVAKLQLEAYGAETRFEELQKQVSDIKAELSDMSSGVRSRTVDSDGAGLLHLYKEMLERSMPANSIADASFDTTRIIEPAVIPDSPSIASGFLLIGLTVMGAGGFGVSWAVFAEFRRRGFDDAHEVEAYLGQPVFGMLPNINGVVPLAAEIKLSSREQRWALESYTFIEGVRGIFNTILPYSGDEESQSSKIVAVTSCFPYEGKTVLTLSLARQSASSGAKVLLIEGDMRKFGLEAKLGTVSPKSGLIDLLSGKTDEIDDVIVREA